MTLRLGLILIGFSLGGIAHPVAAQRYVVTQDRNTGCVENATAGKPLPKTISGGMLNERAILLPKPAVRISKGENFGRKASVQVLVGEDGSVVSAALVSGSKHLKTAVEGAALQARFRPTILSGAPVKVSGIIQYKF